MTSANLRSGAGAALDVLETSTPNARQRKKRRKVMAVLMATLDGVCAGGATIGGDRRGGWGVAAPRWGGPGEGGGVPSRPGQRSGPLRGGKKNPPKPAPPHCGRP